MHIRTSLQQRQATRAVVVALLAIGCRGGANGSGSGPSTFVVGSSTFVGIESTLMQSGFARGSLRQDRSLPGYKISKGPVSWGEFNACVQAGRCAKADRSGCPAEAYGGYPGHKVLPYDEPADDAPATCVGESQAESFCHALGGRLPTLDEWLLAARGPAPARFSWGDAPITATRHPLGEDLEALRVASAPSPVADQGAPGARPTGTIADLAVGKHSAGASPMGIEDVLLAPGELLASDREGLYAACATTGKHCVVFGAEPAAIDAVEPFYTAPASVSPKPDGAKPTLVSHAYAFRCVLDASHEVSP